MTFIPYRMVTNEEVLKTMGIKLTQAHQLMKMAGFQVSLKPLGIIDTNMDMTHITGRNWEVEDALRDIIQNAMDEDEDVGKTFSPNDVLWHNGVTIVVDYGRGITEKAFGLGGTKSDECHRGGFGEGLKLALGTFIKYGHSPVILATKEKVYIADRFPLVANLGSIALTVNSEWLGIVVAKPKYEKPFPYGTAVIIPDRLNELNARNILPKGKTVFETHLPPTIGEDQLGFLILEGPCRKTYRIIEGEVPSAFYIGGLFMTPTEKTSVFGGKSSYYSYDLWGNPQTGDIEASRRNFYEQWRAVYKIYWLWVVYYQEKPAEAVKSFAKIIKASMDKHGKIIIVKPSVGELSMWERAVNLPPSATRKLRELTTKALEEATGVKKEDMVRVSLSATEISNLQNLLWLVTDKNVVVWDSTWPEPDVPDITHALMEKVREQVNAINRAKYDDSLMALMLENFVKVLLGWELPVKVHVGERTREDFIGLARNTLLPDGTPAPEILVMAVDRPNRYIRNWQELLDIISHESAHVYPARYGSGGTLKDMTEEFVRTLSVITSRVLMNAGEITAKMFLLDMADKRRYMTPKVPTPYLTPQILPNPKHTYMSQYSPCPRGHRVMLAVDTFNMLKCLPLLVPYGRFGTELDFQSSTMPLLLLKRNEAKLVEAYSVLKALIHEAKFVSTPMSVATFLRIKKDLPPEIKREAVAKYGANPILIQGRTFETLKELGLLNTEITRYTQAKTALAELEKYLRNLLEKRKEEYDLL